MSLLVDQGVPEGTCNQVLRSTSVDLKRFESIKIFCVKIDRNCNFVGLLHHPFWLELLLALLGHYFSTFSTTFFGEGSLTRVQYPDMHIWSILIIKSDLKWCIHLSRSLYLSLSMHSVNLCYF